MDELIIPDIIYPLLSEAILPVEILLHLYRTHHKFVLETDLLCLVTSRVVAHNIAPFDSADTCRTYARGFHALSSHSAERCARMFGRSVIPFRTSREYRGEYLNT